jgi:hypothetical protein
MDYRRHPKRCLLSEIFGMLEYYPDFRFCMESESEKSFTSQYSVRWDIRLLAFDADTKCRTFQVHRPALIVD